MNVYVIGIMGGDGRLRLHKYSASSARDVVIKCLVDELKWEAMWLDDMPFSIPDIKHYLSEANLFMDIMKIDLGCLR